MLSREIRELLHTSTALHGNNEMPAQKPIERDTASKAARSDAPNPSAMQAGPLADAVFQDLVEAARCMLVILRADCTIAYFNAFAEELTGYSGAEVLRKNYLDTFVPATVRGEVDEHFRRAISGMSRGEIEHPLSAKGDSLRWVVCSLQCLDDYPGEGSLLLTAQDVTVHKRTKDMLQHRTHDLGERIKELNCLFGLSKLVEDPGIDLDGILQGLVDILPPGWQYPEATCGRIVFENREFRTYNFKETRWKQAAPIMVHGRVAGTIEVYYLEEKPAMHEGPFLVEERRLINALAEQLGRIADRRKLEKEIAEISTREQQRIGQELHDGLGQELTGLGYLAETLLCDLRDRNAAEANTADQLARGIERALEQARTIAKGLVPVEIDAEGLVPSLEQLVANTQLRCGVNCRFLCRQPIPIEDTTTAAQLFRIVQEAINNAAKHAEATEIAVELKVDDAEVAFLVRDDGVGIPADLEQATGMGLRIMHHRAAAIGAALNVRAAQRGGTVVTCSLPRGDRP
jgi:PAS domain S-box-containing protein